MESRKGVGTFCRTRKPKAIVDLALVCFFPSSYIFPRIAAGFDELAHRLGYHMLFNHSGHRLEREREILTKLKTRGVGGIALEPINPGSEDPYKPVDLSKTNYALLREIGESGIGVVLLDSDFGDSSFPAIIQNDRGGGEMAARYLWERGHREIGIVCSKDHLAKKLRAWGALDFFASVGVIVPDSWRIAPEITCEAEQSIEEFFAGTVEHPRAFLCTNDEEAVALYRVVSHRGLRVPQDISVISFDNSEYSRLPGFELTSIDHPGVFIGEKAAEILADHVEHTGLKYSSSITIEPLLVERSSVLDLRPRTEQKDKTGFHP